MRLGRKTQSKYCHNGQWIVLIDFLRRLHLSERPEELYVIEQNFTPPPSSRGAENDSTCMENHDRLRHFLHARQNIGSLAELQIYCLNTNGGPLTRFPLRSTVTSTRSAILTKGIPLFIP